MRKEHDVKFKTLSLIAVLVLTVLVSGCSEKAPPQEQAAAGEQGAAAASGPELPVAPDFDLLDLEGNHVKLSDYRGKTVVLDFWATWCPPCRRALPHLQELQDEYADQGIVVVAIATDQQGLKVVKPFVEQQGFTFKVVLGGAEVANAFGGVRSIPTTFFITPDGRIAGKFVGYRPLDEYVRMAMKAKNS